MGSDTLESLFPESNAEPGRFASPIAMKVVCGTDFSENAMEASEVAAALAARLREPLVVAHASDEPSRILLPDELRKSLRSFEQQRLHEEAQHLQREHLVVQEAFRDGAPSDVLAQFAALPSTRLMILSSGRRKSPSNCPLGSVAESVTESSPAPTLVVRNPTPLVRWLRGNRKLRVFVIADFSIASDAALAWVHWMRQIGRCDVVVACVESLVSEGNAFDMQPSPSAANLLARIEQTEKTCFRRHVRAILATDRMRVRFEEGWRRSDAHLLQLARNEEAELIVVGMNERNGISRGAHQSVSHAMLHYAPTNVACVPARNPAPSIAIARQ